MTPCAARSCCSSPRLIRSNDITPCGPRRVLDACAGPLHPGSYRLTVMPGASNPGYAAVDRATSPGIAPEGIIELGPRTTWSSRSSFRRWPAPDRTPARPGPPPRLAPHRRTAAGVAPPGAALGRGTQAHLMLVGAVPGRDGQGWLRASSPHPPGRPGHGERRASRRARLALLSPTLAMLLVVGLSATASGTQPTGSLSGTVTGDGTALANAG